MIITETMLAIADNTGAKSAQCIKVLGGSKRRSAGVGDVIVVTIKKASPKGIVKKKAVEKAVIVRQTKTIGRPNGTFIRFDQNAIVIINKDGQPKGTRIFGPVARELRDRGYQKIISLAPDVL